MSNSLILEDSPYLQQHANNPVNWFAWNDEVFNKALSEQKPIFLSVGYSSCHWCHVMENEVFENKAIAQILNENFICIKVDKEERPDIDKYYQNLYQIINKRGGGWPLSMFLTHEKKPFYAATYIPPANFINLIKDIHSLYKSDFLGVDLRGNELLKLANLEFVSQKVVNFEDSFIDVVQKKLQRDFDSIYGGFGYAPKFPHSASINLALRLFMITKDSKTVQIATKTLDEMAKGGLRDIVDGGFCRYSTDDIWLIPHFEKMTYDNGLLCESYIKAYEVTKNDFYLSIAKEISDFMLNKMTENGLFYSASDADSCDKNGKKHEGEYFVYTYDELQKSLVDVFGQKRGDELLVILGASKSGNFEGKNIIRNEKLAPISSEVITVLRNLRKNKAYPFIDKKCITSWNCMIIKSLFMLCKLDESYFGVAVDSLEKLTQSIYINDKLYHSFLIGGKEPSINGFLEDYGYMCDCLLQAYQSTFDEKYLILLEKIAKEAINKFYNNGQWYFSTNEFVTDGDLFDSSYPSSIAVLIRAIYIFGCLKSDVYFIDIAQKSIDFYSEFLLKNPIYSGVFTDLILMDIVGIKVFKSNENNLLKIDLSKEPFGFLFKTSDEKIQVCGKFSCNEEVIL